MSRIFQSSGILLPENADMNKWAVIACDQFTSQPEYWEQVEKTVGDAPSTLHLILPEQYLAGDYQDKITAIHETMDRYLAENLFKEYASSYIYVERTLLNGSVRRGLVGMIDLETYDYLPDAKTPIRATEKTVVERIGPRKKVRVGAALELPHVLLLCDDKKGLVLDSLTARKQELPVLYDVELMEEGGHLTGYLVSGELAQNTDALLDQYEKEAKERLSALSDTPMLYAVGDGNHSLATAKACYEALKAENPGKDLSGHPARYALCELENLYDEEQQFEPIHRIITHTEPEKLLSALKEAIGAKESRDEGLWTVAVVQGREEKIWLDPKKGALPIGILQAFLDEYLGKNAGEIDYIHGDEDLKKLAEAEESIGFLLPAMGKSDLFRGIICDGVLPRKTFSMGHAREKRYYMEARRIR